MQICDYGCEQEATYFNKRKNLWCCSPKAHSCPVVRHRNSERQKDPSHIAARQDRFRSTNGVDHHMQLDSVKAKVQATNLERYGVANPGQSHIVREKMKATNLERYGVEASFASDHVKSKIKASLDEKYGGHHMLNTEIKNKVSSTLEDRYGVTNPGQTEASRIQASKPRSREFKEQVSETWNAKTSEEKERIVQLRKERHGFRTPFEFEENRSSRSISKKETKWLDSLGIGTIIRQHRFDDINKVVDGFDPETNTVYLFHGDFWHGNPELFKSEDVNPRTKTTFGELYEATLQYEALMESQGYKLKKIWESEYDRGLCDKDGS